MAWLPFRGCLQQAVRKAAPSRVYVVGQRIMAYEPCHSKHDDARNNRELIHLKCEVAKGILPDQRHLVVVRPLFVRIKDDFDSSFCT